MKQCCFILLLMLFFSGCGQKGPLYLPESEPKTAHEAHDGR
ncbi:MAG TPA: hypothetical protein DDY37_05845 [Legionella sp.]|nr:hypothetical protein [Legionella sp.]